MKWDIRQCELGTNNLSILLEEEWQPFAVVNQPYKGGLNSTEWHTFIWLRRPNPPQPVVTDKVLVVAKIIYDWVVPEKERRVDHFELTKSHLINLAQQIIDKLYQEKTQ